MSTAAGVCCIVLNHFGAEHTRTCARSLLGQPVDRLYLVDNSAHALERAAMRALAAELACDGAHFSVGVLCPAQNLGYARGVNAAIAADRLGGGHALYLLLNNDALLPPGAVAALVRAQRAHPPAALVGPRLCGGGRAPTCGLHYWTRLGHQSRGPSPWATHFLTGACLLLDAAFIEPGGPFDAAFFLYGEDVLLNHAIRQRGGVLRCAADLVVPHAGSASSDHGSLFYEYHVARGHLLLAHKLARSRWEGHINLLGRVVYLPLRALLRCLRQRSLAPARALWLLWRNGSAPDAKATPAGRRGVPKS